MWSAAASAGDVGSPSARIALTWLVRLRWVAAAGQVAAVLAASAVMNLATPLWLLAIPIAMTILTNAALQVWMRRGEPPALVLPVVILLDTALLTSLLALTGGAQNPFGILYLVHVAMAAAVLGPAWSWAVAGASAACLGLLLLVSRPLTTDGSLRPCEECAGHAVALLLAAGLMAYFVARVTGSLRQRERELAEARRQADRGQRLASLATLAAGAAHELGTPLGTIAIVARELEVGTAPPTALAEDARLIRQEVERCRRILSRMRVDVPDERSAVPEAVSADALVQSLKESLEPGEAPRLRVRVDGGATTLVLPQRAVQQALGVLIRNAFDASGDDQTVELRIARHDGEARFEVQDFGRGMSQEVLARAGEPFFTTKPPGAGMGLGLFLARSLAERHGGSLRLDSRPGAGTRAWLTWPEVQRELKA